MRKFVSLVLSVLFLIGLLSACGRNEIENPTTQPSGTVETSPSDKDEEINLMEPGYLKNGSVTVLDKDGITIKFTSLEKHFYGEEGDNQDAAYRLSGEIVNNADCDIFFSVDCLEINGITFDNQSGYIHESIDAQSTLQFSQDIFCDDLIEAGISEIRNIVCYSGKVISYNPSFSWDVEFELDCGDMKYTDEVDMSGEIIHDADGIKFIYKGVKDLDDDGTKKVSILVVNETDEHLHLDLEFTKLNGVRFVDYTSVYVHANSSNYFNIIWLGYRLEPFNWKLDNASFNVVVLGMNHNSDVDNITFEESINF